MRGDEPRELEDDLMMSGEERWRMMTTRRGCLMETMEAGKMVHEMKKKKD